MPSHTPTTTPTATATPLLDCVVRPPLFIVGVVQLPDRRLEITGLSLDNAWIQVLVKAPNDLDFVLNGTANADPFGTWVYTTTVFMENGTHEIRAFAYGVRSENTVAYTMQPQQPLLNLRTHRVGYQGYATGLDTYLSQEEPLVVHNTGVTVSIETEDIRDPLLWFDTRAIPTNANVLMAKLSLYSMDALTCTKLVACSYQVTRAWSISDANWISATQSITWTEPGANDTLYDRESLATYTETIEAPFVWYTWDVTTMVQDWIANPASNRGVIIKGWTIGREVWHTQNDLDRPDVGLILEPLLNGMGGQRDFASSEYPAMRRRPVLYVTYTVP